MLARTDAEAATLAGVILIPFAPGFGALARTAAVLRRVRKRGFVGSIVAEGNYREVGRQPLVIVDGVCSVAGEELRMSEWGVDVALTASQKAISVPPGLALVVASPRALQAFKQRKTPVMSYYSDWANWLPIMEAYEARKPSYFGTPAVNLVFALNVSLGQILDEGLEKRFARHVAISRACKAAIGSPNLPVLPARRSSAIALGWSSLLYSPRNDSLSQSKDFKGSLTDIKAVNGQSTLLCRPLSSGKPHKHLRAYTVLAGTSADVSMNSLWNSRCSSGEKPSNHST